MGRTLESLLSEDGHSTGLVPRLLSFDSGRKGGGIKPAKSAAVRVGPVTELLGLRTDGNTMHLSVQSVAKQGHRYVVRGTSSPNHGCALQPHTGHRVGFTFRHRPFLSMLC